MSRARPTRSVVVLVPESGDSIQTLKAGLMEIADIFAVNKADRPGADRLRNELELMLGMRPGAVAADAASASRRRPVARAISRSRCATPRSARRRTTLDAAGAADRAAQGEGIGELVDALDRHFRYLETSGTLRERRRARLRERVVDVVEDKIAPPAVDRRGDRRRGSTSGCPSSRPDTRHRSGSPTRCSPAAPTC